MRSADTALAQALANGTLVIVGAVKDMSSGRVRFLQIIGDGAELPQAAAERVPEPA